MHINQKISSRDANVEYGNGFVRIRLTHKRSAASQARRLIDEVADIGGINPVDLGFAREVIRVWKDYGERQQLKTFVGTRISVDRM